ncbi:MAG TPA: oligopeptide ABC transporter permease OppB [Rhizomicrobium sp.]|nr:oligopeptide ABC transporter permease OppB [Rhizomicrobium sp.]
MLSYAIRRLLGAIPTLFIIITLAFFMMRLAPGGPFDSQRRLPPEIEHNIKAAYNLDKPVYQQYFIYLGKLAHGDLGPSYKNKDFTVSEMISDGLPVSAKLGLSAILLAVLIGVTLGTVAALRQNKATDYTVMTAAMIGITIPTFVAAPILTLIFGVYGLTVFGYDISLPVGGWNGGAIRNMILPVIVLALPQIAVISRLTRGSMVEVLHSNYVRTARAKGLSSFQVVVRHALRAAILPLVSYLGPAIAGILTGSLVVEQIFGIPGIGRYFVQGALNRDYTLVMGVLIYYATFVILLNLLADILYAVLDPRVRYAK